MSNQKGIINFKPNIIFLQETKLSKVNRNIFDKIWDRERVQGQVVLAEGSAGGLMCIC